MGYWEVYRYFSDGYIFGAGSGYFIWGDFHIGRVGAESDLSRVNFTGGKLCQNIMQIPFLFFMYGEPNSNLHLLKNI